MFENQNKILLDEATDFHDKDMSKAGSNIICWAVITTDPALKDKNHAHVFKRMQIHWKRSD